jgi:hypothetical protein
MPFKSLAQEGYMHAHPEILGKAGLKEWDSATKGKHLPKHAKHGFTHSEIKHHHDGSHTVTHHHVDPSKTVEHAVPDLAGAQDSLEQHIGAGAQASEPPPMQAAPGGMPGAA